MLKRITPILIALILAFGLAAGISRAQDAPAATPLPPPSELDGTWNLSARALNGPKEKCSINFKKSGGEGPHKTYTGTWESEMLGKVEIKEATLDGNDFKFSTIAKLGSAEVPVEFTAVILRNHWNGKYLVKSGDQVTEMRFQGAKKVEFEKLTGPANLPGDWQIEIEAVTGNISTAAMNVKADGSKYEAFIQTEIGKGAVEGMKLTGNALTFKTKVNFNGIMVPLAFEGTTAGDRIAGVARANFNQQEMEFPLTAKRGKVEPPAVGPVDPKHLN